MAKKLQMYMMPVYELLAKKELLRILVEVGALWTHGMYPNEKPSLVWDEYNFLTDGEKWYFQRPHYQEGTYQNGMIAYARQIELKGTHQYILPYTDDEPYTYNELTDIITSEIEVIPNKNNARSGVR